MGSWNHTCAVSNLHITAGTEVAVFMLFENKVKKHFTYGSALYDVFPIPFYGKYDDYGGVEDCHGYGLDVVLNFLKENVYEVEAENEFDVDVSRSTFDIDMLFRADHKDKLGVVDMHHYLAYQDAGKKQSLKDKSLATPLSAQEQQELDYLYVKLAKAPEAFRRVTHVVIHGDIFRRIINDFYVEKYVGNNLGNTGYNNSYLHLYFRDLEASIPGFISQCKEKKSSAQVAVVNAQLASVYQIFSDHSSENHAARMISHSTHTYYKDFSMFDSRDYLADYIIREDWDNLALFVKEHLTGIWINMFMTSTRKLWTKQTGLGSQDSDHTGYRILVDEITNILDEEQKDYGEEE